MKIYIIEKKKFEAIKSHIDGYVFYREKDDNFVEVKVVGPLKQLTDLLDKIKTDSYIETIK
jgi:hypothetical protein